MPEYDYIYLGDNARTPYGTRSFEVVYEFTLQAVNKLFALGCPLVILACNTASAKALRTIQQMNLPQSNDPTRRVLGVIRPTAECIGTITYTRHIGILATAGTIKSQSYPLEVHKPLPGDSPMDWRMYRSDMEAYRQCVEAYLATARQDAERIRKRMEKAVREYNEESGNL